MYKHYEPKSDGIGLLRYAVARVRSRIAKMEKEGREYKNPVVTINFEKAMEILDVEKKKKSKIRSIIELSSELSFELDKQYADLNPTKLKALAERILIHASSIE